MQVQVEVKQATGEIRQGQSRSTGKPYKMAEQEVAVFMPGADYPVVAKRDIYVPKERDGTFGEPEWMKPGRYSVQIVARPDRYGRLEVVFDFRNAKPLTPAAVPNQKAA